MSNLIDTALNWWRHGEPPGLVERPTSNGEAGPIEDCPRPIVVEKKAAIQMTTQAETQPPAHSVTSSVDAPYLTQLDRCGLPRTLVYPTTTLGRLLDQTADRFGPATAIVYNHRTWTWEEVRQQANRMAGGLATLGVRRGDRVVVTLPNCPEYLITFFAVQKLGAVLVNAGPLMGVDDLQQVLTITSARVVIGLDLQAPILARAGKDSAVEHWIWVSLAFYQTVLKRLGYHLKVWHESKSPANKEQHISLPDLLETAPARPPTVDPEPERLAVLQPTGGTTGGVKLVQLSHRNLIANAAQVSVWASVRPGQDRIMAALPMFHVYGLTTCLVTAVYGAMEMILLTRFAAEEMLELIRRYRPTVLPLVPAMCEPICNAIEREMIAASKHNNGRSGSKQNGVVPGGIRLDSVRACISGAAPLPMATVERFQRLTGVELVEGYGLSEAGPVTHINPIGHARIGSIGLPVADTLCRVVDLDSGTIDVPPGEAGELLIHGPQVMSGYFSSAEQTQKAIHQDVQGRSWLHTGDVVRMENDGYFRVLDRKKDMIIRSGLKVYPAKVEKVLRSHPKVTDVAVIGRPDPIHTEEVVTFIVTSAPVADQPRLARELRAFCRQHLAPYEVPAKVEFIDKLPRSGLGKLLKKDLRKIEPAESSPDAGLQEVEPPAPVVNKSDQNNPDKDPGKGPPHGHRPEPHSKEAA